MPSEFLDQLTWVAVDTETTGLNPWKNELLEIGAVRFQLDSEFEEFEVLIKPEGKIDPRSRAVHNITNEEIEERGKDLETAMKMFVEFIGKDSLVFHNAPFDISFLLRGIEKVNLPVPDNTYYDSLYLSRKYFAHRKKHSLSALREQLDLPEEVLHRALPDARLTAHVFSETIRSKAEQLTSNNKYQSFIRSHGRFSKFKIKLPKNMEDIYKYFERHSRSGTVMKIDFKDQANVAQTNLVKIIEVMVFNQNPFVKVIVHPEGKEKLIPLRTATIHDPDKGKVKLVE